MQISYGWLLGDLLLALHEDIYGHLPLVLIILCYHFCIVIKHLVLIIVCVANNYCMDGLNWILVLFFTCGMYGSFSYKYVIQM